MIRSFRFVLCIALILLGLSALTAPAGQCPPGQLPHPSIISNFVPDSSCAGSDHNGSVGGEPKRGCIVACELQYATYCTQLNAGNTYIWAVTGGTIASGQGTTCVTVLWGPAGSGTISVLETKNDSCSGKDSSCVKIINSPVASFTTTTNVCLNTPLTFVNNSLNAINYFWNFGDGNTSTLFSPTHSYTTAGTYTITLVAYNKCGCSDSTQMTVNVSGLQGPRIVCPATVCADAQACYSTPDGCPTAVYNWIVNGGVIIGPTNGPGICVQWGNGPIGTVGLFITGCGNVCPETTKVIVPIVSPTATIGGPAVVCPSTIATYSLPTWPGVYYNWTISGGGTIISGLNTQAITVQWGFAPGTYTIAASWVDTTLGCKGSALLQVNVLPEFIMSGPSGPFCLGSTSTYFASANANWTVTGGNTFTGNGTNSITVTWSSAGVQTVTAAPAAANTYCNPSVSMTAVVVSVPPATAITGPQIVCPGTGYQYLATASGPGYTFLWTVSGGGAIVGSPSANPVTVQWSGPGTISVQQVQLSPPSCPSAPISISVGLFTVPSITGPAIACMDQPATYTAGSPNPSINYQWSIVDGSGNPSPYGSITLGQGSNQISVLWHGPGGTAVVKLVVCSNTLTLPVTINPKPVPVITKTGILCPSGGSATLSVPAVYVSYLWSNGAVTPSTSVTSPGNYTVTVTNSNGCIGTASITVNPSPGPVASISTPDLTNYCLPATISTTFYALQGPGYTYVWYPGAIAGGPTFTATATGTYYVVVTDANGCSTTSNSITVSAQTCGSGGGCTPLPYTLSFTQTPGAPNCNLITFNATTSNVTNLSWSFGDGGTAGNVTTTSHTYTSAGYYVVQLCGQVPSTTGGTCPICTTLAVSVPVVADFNFVNTCGTVNFTDLSTHLPSFPITSWTWSFPGGSPSSSTLQTPPPVTYSGSGPFSVTLTVSDGSCIVSKTLTVNIPPAPAPSFSLPATACAGLDIPLNGNGTGITTWAWTFGDNATSGVQNTSHAFATAGTYTITLVATNAAGCTGSVSHTITVWPPATGCTIVPSNPNPICQGDSVILTASPGSSYQWYFNGNLISGAILPTYAALVGGNYTVTVFDANGCPCKTQPVTVVVNPPPTIQISSNPGPSLCAPGQVTLTTYNDPNYTYLWTFVSGPATPPIFNPNANSTGIFLSTPGIYVFQVTVTDANGCTNTATYSVKLNPTPPPISISSSGPTVLCKGGSVTLTSSSPVNNQWSTGATTQSITVNLAGTYAVTVTFPSGCTSTATIGVSFSIADFSLYPFGCDKLCDSAKIPGPIGPYLGYYSYQWQLNGVNIPPANGTNQQLFTTTSGIYTLILTGPGPTFCKDTSGTYNVTIAKCDTVCKGTICGRKWNDKNGNHKFNYGSEFGIAHWKICLVKCNVDGYPGKDTVACTYTDSLGFYCFTNVCPGCYCVVEEHKPGWQQTWPISPPFYHVVMGDSSVIMGNDFGNKFKCIRIWSTVDTVGVPKDAVLSPDVVYPAPAPWPYTVKYSGDQGLSWEPVFNGIVTENVSIIPGCKPGWYQIKRGHLANFVPDRVYVNDTLKSDGGSDSVTVILPDSTDGITILFLNTRLIDTRVAYRTFTASQLAQDDQIKPVKRPKPGKPVIMPNTANVLNEIMQDGLVLVAGMPAQLTSSGKILGYLQPGKQSDIFKTFNTKGVVHTGRPRGLDFDLKGKPILKRQKSVPATKHDNRFLANLLALKINIAASEAGKTPPGFGGLIYLPTGDLPWLTGHSEWSIDMIAELADSMLTRWSGRSYQEYDDINAILDTLNGSFADLLPFGPEDTVKWAVDGRLVLNGTRPLADVPYLIKVDGLSSRSIFSRTPVLVSQPSTFTLSQNYPNPFNPTTTIQFELNEQAHVSLKVFNMLGEQVATILNGQFLDEGAWEFPFDAGKLSSGVYLYQLTVETLGNPEEGTSGSSVTRIMKMVLLK